MKKVVIFCLFLISLSSFTTPSQEELKWCKWNDAYPLAQKQGKILLIDAYTDWCGWCKKMDKDTYSNPEVIKLINKHFIPVKFNPELRDLTYEIDGQTFTARDFYAQLTRGENTGFPTTYFIDPKKKSLFIDPGYRNAETFMQILEKVIADK